MCGLTKRPAKHQNRFAQKLRDSGPLPLMETLLYALHKNSFARTKVSIGQKPSGAQQKKNTAHTSVIPGFLAPQELVKFLMRVVAI